MLRPNNYNAKETLISIVYNITSRSILHMATFYKSKDSFSDSHALTCHEFEDSPMGHYFKTVKSTDSKKCTCKILSSGR